MSMRPKNLARKTGINLVPILIYIGVAVVVAAGMFAWDVKYRRDEAVRRLPPSPEVIAKNLVENIVGSDTVRDVKVDAEKKAVTVTFDSVLFKPEKPKKDMRELLEAEATLAAQAVLMRMLEYGQVNAVLMNQGKTLAVAEAVRGKDKISITFMDERLKD